MSELKFLIIDIDNYAEGDGPEGLILRTQYKVISGLNSFTYETEPGCGCTDNKTLDVENESDNKENNRTEVARAGEGAFLITDSLSAAHRAEELNIGTTVYIGGGAEPSEFTNALYCVDSVDDLSDESIVRMYERAAGIPWTILETDRCVVREITVDDVDRLYEIYDDPETTRYIEDLYEDRERELQFTRDYIDNQYRFFEYGLWVVIYKETGEIIGRAGIFNRENQEKTEIGFVFERSFWGRGIAAEVITAIEKYALEELEITELTANVEVGNTRSEALLKKLGYKYAGEKVIEGKTYSIYDKIITPADLALC